MRLIFTPLNEIFFKKADDDRMQGTIEMNNPTSDTIFAFKVSHLQFRSNAPIQIFSK